MFNDERFRLLSKERSEERPMRFCTMGHYSLTEAHESRARAMAEVV